MEATSDGPIVMESPLRSQMESDSSRGKASDGNEASLSQEESAKQNKAMFAKEEDDFLKLESIFITELGLGSDQLPNFLK